MMGRELQPVSENSKHLYIYIIFILTMNSVQEEHLRQDARPRDKYSELHVVCDIQIITI
jgi:hypothetical protein